MSENKGKIYDDINRLPKVSYEAIIEILGILQEAAKGCLKKLWTYKS